MASRGTSHLTRRAIRVVGSAAFAVGLVLVLLRVPVIWGSGEDSLKDPSKPSVWLVSAEHPLPSGYRPARLVSLANLVPVSTSSVSVAAEVEKPLRELFDAARKAGLGNMYVASGYRDSGEQKDLWDQADDKSFVQKPGHSEHQTGLAVDIADLKVGQGDFGESRAGRWLAKNAWRYGFVLRYPAGKTAITGIAYEPWHFRYVGKKVAKACRGGDLTLEEYAGRNQ